MDTLADYLGESQAVNPIRGDVHVLSRVLSCYVTAARP